MTEPALPRAQEVMEPPAILKEPHQRLEAELRRLVGSHPEPLYRIMEYALGWTEPDGAPRPGPAPQRIHGAICLLTAQTLAVNPGQTRAAAAAVELMHQASLVHDDIRDANPERAGRPSVWWVWGPAQAINVGDSLDALARLALLEMEGRGVASERVLKAAQILDQASLSLCEGQYLEAQHQEQLQVTRAAYLRMVEKRAGALLGAALELGALLANVDDGQLSHYRRAGQRLGLALQVRRDLGVLWQGPRVGRPPPGDFLNKKKNLAVVHALEAGALPVKRELGTLYLQRVLSAEDLPRMVQLLEATGSHQYCQEEMERAQKEALEALAQAGLSRAAIQEFQQLADFFLLQEL